MRARGGFGGRSSLSSMQPSMQSVICSHLLHAMFLCSDSVHAVPSPDFPLLYCTCPGQFAEIENAVAGFSAVHVMLLPEQLCSIRTWYWSTDLRIGVLILYVSAIFICLRVARVFTVREIAFIGEYWFTLPGWLLGGFYCLS